MPCCRCGRCGGFCGRKRVDDSSWPAALVGMIAHPEKVALALVIAVGAWRWIRELVREARGAAQEETLLEMLLRENRELREELRRLRKEHHDE